MENFVVKKLELNDWQDYRKFRLEALSLHPDLFAPSRDETKMTDDEWKQRLTDKEACTFGLYCNNELIGITGVYRNKDEPEKVHLVASYVQSAYRKKRLSRLLYESRVKWAYDQQNVKYIYVDHYEDNEPSFRAQQKFGFIYDSFYDSPDQSGRMRRSVIYKLVIR